MYQSQAVIGITNARKNPPLEHCVWPADAMNNIPDWVYTSQAIYDQEIERIFRGDTWNFVALEAEIPNPGDYKRGYVGATAVVIVRAEDHTISVFENRCAHRGAEFCRASQGNTKEFVCPYHQWSYDLKETCRAFRSSAASTRSAACRRTSRTPTTAPASCVWPHATA